MASLIERRRDWCCTSCGHVAWTVRKPRRCGAFDDCAGKLEPLAKPFDVALYRSVQSGGAKHPTD